MVLASTADHAQHVKGACRGAGRQCPCGDEHIGHHVDERQLVGSAKSLTKPRPRIAQVGSALGGDAAERTQLRKAKSCNVMSDEQLRRKETQWIQKIMEILQSQYTKTELMPPERLRPRSQKR